jgi:hypothetical protein
MIVTPIVMAFVFFGVVLPIGLLMRALGKECRRLIKDNALATHVNVSTILQTFLK